MPSPSSSLPRPLLVAYRGASLAAPANTLEAFDVAARLGAQALQLDVRASADGVWMVARHAVLARMTDGVGRLDAVDARAVSRLDAGCHFVTASGERPFLGRGVRLPQLVDVLRGFPRLGMHLVLRGATPARVPALLDALMRVAPAHVVLLAPDAATMAALVAARPGCPLGTTAAEAAAVVRGAWRGAVPPPLHGRLLTLPPRRYGLPLISGRVLRAARAAGLRVHAGVIDRLAPARRLLARGVDGVLTRDPAHLSALFYPSQGDPR